MGVEDAVLRVRNVGKTFGNQSILSDISLEIQRGEIFGIIGASGSGKTTFLNLISGNLIPDKGRITFEPKAFTKFDESKPYMEPLLLNPYLVKKTIGYSPQTPSFYDKLTCYENLDLFGTLYEIPKDIKKVNIHVLLDLVGLKDSEGKRAEELSGGMKKRLDLACSLIHDPKILILDEPTADLDIVLRRQLWGLIKKINSKGTTVIMSSHFLDEIKELCDRIAIIDNHGFEYIGPPKEVDPTKLSNVIIKLETIEKKYSELGETIQNTIHGAKIMRHENQLVIRVENVKHYSKQIEKLMGIIKKSGQSLLDFNSEREGISQLFESVRSRKETEESKQKRVEKKQKIQKIKLQKWKL